MGADQLIAWRRCVGHRPENCASPEHARLLEQALVWTMGDGSKSCC
jgi:hypothetical protein